MKQQSGGGLAAERQAGPGMGLREAACPMGVAAKQMREPLGEGTPRATGLPAVEAPDRQLQPDDLAACR